MRHRLRDVFPTGRPRPPLLPVSSDFYLSVLAAKAVLPSILDIVQQRPTGRAVAGMGVPMSRDAKKEDLAKPLVRGVYALSTPDRKTVLKLRVLSKEEAGFDPSTVARTLQALSLDPEVMNRVLSTWSILQLTFEAYDPALYPSLDFVTTVASRLAGLTEGVVADPLAGQYRLPEHYPSVRTEDEPVVVTDHVSVITRPDDGLSRLSTAGLVKFAQPELAITQVSPALEPVAQAFLLSVAAGVLRGKTVEPGDRLVSSDGWVAGGSPETHEVVSVIELLPLKGTVEGALSQWARTL